MKIVLERELDHQEEAITAIIRAIGNPHLTSSKRYNANPLLPSADKFKNSIKEAQDYSNIPKELRSKININEFLNLDIKMETGTGKTYTYTKAIFELNKFYNLNKFIIVVPTLAIKSGIKQFLNDSYTQHHFRDELGYHKNLKLHIIQASKRNNKERLIFPESIRSFISSPSQNSKEIHILLINSALLTSGKILKQNYETSVEGFYNPFEALKSINPIIIIDEPHKFSKNNITYKVLKEKLRPQLMLRFGATFPIQGKLKKSKKDYENLIYDLNARDSFNRGLIKGIAKEHLGQVNIENKKIKLKKVKRNEYAEFDLITESKLKSYRIPLKSSIGIIDDSLSNITLEFITNKTVEFSNGIVLNIGEQVVADIYMESYQRSMIDLALTRHFEVERKNFNRNKKIKTIALFFIDDINSYRSSDENIPYINLMFEELLEQHIKNLIPQLKPYEIEYRNYLQESLNNLKATHGGYFAKDKGSTDKEIIKEVEEILCDKKNLLSLYDQNGNYNLRRFIFSKWTLREGWDCPNVFTIVKLRGSGSEISKLQEVGRGLRLPVDEQGNRIVNEEFILNYIVDFTEANFAQKLVEEINKDISATTQLSEDQIEKIANIHNISKFKAISYLLNEEYIDENYNINKENLDDFIKKYPELKLKNFLHKNKIRDRNKEFNKNEQVTIRSNVYSELEDLWKLINERFILFYDNNINNYVKEAVYCILRENIFSESFLNSKQTILTVEEDSVNYRESMYSQINYSNEIPYGRFLIKLSKITHIPITILNEEIFNLSREFNINTFLFNERTIQNFNRIFVEWKLNNLVNKFYYKRIHSSTKETALTNRDGSLKEEIDKYRLGIQEVENIKAKENFLYDSIVYDSELEKNNILNSFDLEDGKSYVYGKIPKNSISIPLIDGSTYSPDFMYVIKYPNGKREINLIIETKNYKNMEEISNKERILMKCAENFFKTLSKEGIKVHYKIQLNNLNIKEIIQEIDK